MAEETTPDSRERIMEATYRALLEKGYADLTMSDIAAKSDTSTSLLHYHFDTKEDLLVAFLDHSLDRWANDIAETSERDPIDRLHDLLNHYVLDADETERESFHIALGEVRGQAPYNERYRERFERADALITEEVADILRTGMASGAIADDGDPISTAQLLIAAGVGARTKGIALGEYEHTQSVFEQLYRHILQPMFSVEAIERWEELEGS